MTKFSGRLDWKLTIERSRSDKLNASSSARPKPLISFSPPFHPAPLHILPFFRYPSPMDYHKSHQPENFSFPGKGPHKPGQLVLGRRNFRYRVTDLGEDIFRLVFLHRQWGSQKSQAKLCSHFSGESRSKLHIHNKGLSLRTHDGSEILASEPGRLFGVSGRAWMLQLRHEKNMQFYGLGEKCLGLEVSGIQTKFWNTDVWSDFDEHHYQHGNPDPLYASIPYLIIKRGNQYAGILVNNPYPVFINTNPKILIGEVHDPALGKQSRFFVGSPDGLPELYLIVGPSLQELTQKLQRLCGTTPLPPLWALGHHQCRWGYESYRDLDRLDQSFRKHKIPNDGLWLDIDYMSEFRVFTFNSKHFPSPTSQVQDLRDRNRHVVPIFDPGVKVDPKFSVYRSALKNKVLCQNPEGTPYVGFVWPGATVFPDFSLESARKWWRDQVASFSKHGFSGAWIDMNDPSTGASENTEMLFQNGKDAHDTYHNQYALGMAEATRAGFLAHQPDRRPFLLSRSAFIGSSQFSAVWTGDKVSNTHHLQGAIPLSLNLALSGIPFNGPDVPGFGGDATPELAATWYKAGFLFPFFRNHTAKATRNQEPWAFGSKTTRIIRHYIQMRYKLLPYLYNLFIDQEEDGTAILRPLFHDFQDTKRLPLGFIDDQFLVGPSILQAPILDPQKDHRELVLPKGRWFDARDGKWVDGGKRLRVQCKASETPLYVRNGSMIPLQPGTRTDNDSDLSTVDLHVFIDPKKPETAETLYRFDDGVSFDYKKGARTSFRVIAKSRKANGLKITVDELKLGYKACNARFFVYGSDPLLEVEIENNPGSRESLALQLKESNWTFTGKRISCRTTNRIRIGK